MMEQQILPHIQGKQETSVLPQMNLVVAAVVPVAQDLVATTGTKQTS